MAYLGRSKAQTGAAVGVLLVLSPVALAACGDDEDPAGSDNGSLEVSGDYCTDIEAVEGLLATAEQSDPGQFGTDLESARQVADEAPKEVASDWDMLIGALDQYESVLSDVGITPEEMAGGAQNLDLSDEELRTLSSGVGEIFLDPELQTAGENIAAHAKDSCDVDLAAAGADGDPFCAELENVDLLGVDTTKEAAADVARGADELAADAPAEIKDDLRTVSGDYRELSKIEDDSARAMAYIGSDISDATFQVVRWKSDNC